MQVLIKCDLGFSTSDARGNLDASEVYPLLRFGSVMHSDYYLRLAWKTEHTANCFIHTVLCSNASLANVQNDDGESRIFRQSPNTVSCS